MNIESRIKKLERTIPETSRRPHLGVDEIVFVLEEYGKQGYFDKEPDFPASLALYREARTTRTDTREAFAWIAHIFERVYEGIPPVSEAEFRELAQWYSENEEMLRRDNKALLGNAWKINQGPRACYAGEIAEALRRLKAAVESV